MPFDLNSCSAACESTQKSLLLAKSRQFSVEFYRGAMERPYLKIEKIEMKGCRCTGTSRKAKPAPIFLLQYNINIVNNQLNASLYARDNILFFIFSLFVCECAGTYEPEGRYRAWSHIVRPALSARA